MPVGRRINSVRDVPVSGAVSSRAALTAGRAPCCPSRLRRRCSDTGELLEAPPPCLQTRVGGGHRDGWARGAGGGALAVELLRSLERQTESLTASKNNPPRVRLPGIFQAASSARGQGGIRRAGAGRSRAAQGSFYRCVPASLGFIGR